MTVRLLLLLLLWLLPHLLLLLLLLVLLALSAASMSVRGFCRLVLRNTRNSFRHCSVLRLEQAVVSSNDHETCRGDT
jgi:hypothetical protein